jgi:transposase
MPDGRVLNVVVTRKDLLPLLDRGLSISGMARECSTSRQTIKKALRREGLESTYVPPQPKPKAPAKPKEVRWKKIDPERFKQLHGEGYTKSELAEEFGISSTSCERAHKKLNLAFNKPKKDSTPMRKPPEGPKETNAHSNGNSNGHSNGTAEEPQNGAHQRMTQTRTYNAQDIDQVLKLTGGGRSHWKPLPKKEEQPVPAALLEEAARLEKWISGKFDEAAMALWRWDPEGIVSALASIGLAQRQYLANVYREMGDEEHARAARETDAKATLTINLADGILQDMRAIKDRGGHLRLSQGIRDYINSKGDVQRYEESLREEAISKPIIMEGDEYEGVYQLLLRGIG